MQELKELKAAWRDHPEFHKHIHESFCEIVNSIPELKAHRDFVEGNNDTPQKIFGFGERSFLYMWWLIVNEMPQEFTFMEIGVFRGQILSLIRLIADMQGKKVTRYGVTPLSAASNAGEATNWESDYRADIELLHDSLNIEKDYTILHGLSTDPAIIAEAQKLRVHILFVDGAHDHPSVMSDYTNYCPLVEKNGFVVCDDACNDLSIWFGGFPGIQACTDATLDYFGINKDYEFIANVVHDRIYKKLV